jgi:hypothetical protein
MIKSGSWVMINEVKMSRYRHAGDKVERNIAPTHS